MTPTKITSRTISTFFAAIILLALVSCTSGGNSGSPSTASGNTSSGSGRADSSSSLPIVFTNNSGSQEPLYIYITGTNTAITSGDKLGYVNREGNFQSWPKTSGAASVDTPDFAIEGPASGATTTLHLPVGISGRLYYAFGNKLHFGLVGAADGSTGLVQPAPWDSADKNYGTLFDWIEFTFTGGSASGTGLWVNPTQVDQFAAPATVEVSGSNDEQNSTGTLVPGGRQKVVDTLLADETWQKTVVKDSSGKLLRVLAPGHATSAGLLPEDYLDSYISSAWSSYGSTPLTIVPIADHPDRKFFGRTSGDVMTFTDSSGVTVASFAKPSSADVWGCDGNLNGVGNQVLPNDQTTGPISRTLCAALTRGTLGSTDAEPVSDPSKFFTNPQGLNVYGKAIHAAMADGKAYAFPFDDVVHQESLVAQSNPTKMTVTVQPLS